MQIKMSCVYEYAWFYILHIYINIYLFFCLKYINIYLYTRHRSNSDFLKSTCVSRLLGWCVSGPLDHPNDLDQFYRFWCKDNFAPPITLLAFLCKLSLSFLCSLVSLLSLLSGLSLMWVNQWPCSKMTCKR